MSGYTFRLKAPATERLDISGLTPAKLAKLSSYEIASLKVGGVVGIDLFKVGQVVDVSGRTIGKGYAGVIKRHHFKSNRATHGNSRSHNTPGSISMAQDPGRVFPGKKMTGHLGDVNRTTQNLVIVRIDAERQLLLIRGAIPGAANGDITVYPAVKPRKIGAKPAAKPGAKSTDKPAAAKAGK